MSAPCTVGIPMVMFLETATISTWAIGGPSNVGVATTGTSTIPARG